MSTTNLFDVRGTRKATGETWIAYGDHNGYAGFTREMADVTANDCAKHYPEISYEVVPREPIPAAACPKCGGWTSFGGMSQHSNSTVPVDGRTGCTCNKTSGLNAPTPVRAVSEKARFAIVSRDNVPWMSQEFKNGTVNIAVLRPGADQWEEVFHGNMDGTHLPGVNDARFEGVLKIPSGVLAELDTDLR